MYLSETLARQRSQEKVREAEERRGARQLAELRRLERVQQRTQRKLLSVWEREAKLRSLLEA